MTAEAAVVVAVHRGAVLGVVMLEEDAVAELGGGQRQSLYALALKSFGW